VGEGRIYLTEWNMSSVRKILLAEHIVLMGGREMRNTISDWKAT
jgi:hypothetical protein